MIIVKLMICLVGNERLGEWVSVRCGFLDAA